MVGLTDGEKKHWRICITVSTEYRRVTDRRTDRRTSCHDIVRAMHTRRAIKTNALYNSGGSRSCCAVDNVFYLSVFFSSLFVQCCKHDILQTNKPISLKIDTSCPRNNGMKWSISEVRRSKIKVRLDLQAWLNNLSSLYIRASCFMKRRT